MRKMLRLSILEVVLILGICGILAAIAIPNFLEWSWRNPMEKAAANHRAFVVALETYCVDHKSYPSMRPLRDFASDPGALKKAGGWDLSTVDPGNETVAGITTPISYLRSMPVDPHSPGGSLPFVYYRSNRRYITISAGPDRHYDIGDPAQVFEGSSYEKPSVALSALTYDPTNGLKSSGDCWRIGNADLEMEHPRPATPRN